MGFSPATPESSSLTTAKKFLGEFLEIGIRLPDRTGRKGPRRMIKILTMALAEFARAEINDYRRVAAPSIFETEDVMSSRYALSDKNITLADALMEHCA